MMTLKFCERCNALMNSREEDELIIFECPSCGFFEAVGDISSLDVKEKMIPSELRGEGAGEDKNDFADYPNVCKKCGYGFAQILDLGIFYSDEDNLVLLKCGKCGFSERIGRKVS
jgi:DNA-directed RNA polymerase subunit M/transcription elongation factor TFIIS